MPTTTATKPRRAKRNYLTELLAQVLAPAGEAVTVADIEGYIIEANDAVETVYRWPRAEILGQHALKFCPETDYWPKLSQEIWQSIKDAGAWDGVVINHDVRGRQFPILLRTRKVTWDGVPYVISFARPFPFGTPFGLSPTQARCFALPRAGQHAKRNCCCRRGDDHHRQHTPRSHLEKDALASPTILGSRVEVPCGAVSGGRVGFDDEDQQQAPERISGGRQQGSIGGSSSRFESLPSSMLWLGKQCRTAPKGQYPSMNRTKPTPNTSQSPSPPPGSGIRG